MAYQQKENDIAIFLVKDKKSDKHPDWTGKALISGEEKEVSLWIKSPTMLAGSIREKFKPGFRELKEEIEETKGPTGSEIQSDDIPW